jgi:hypothetical protein
MVKAVLVFVLTLVAHLFTTFVLTVLWNWFAVPALHASEISFWLMYGLVLAKKPDLSCTQLLNWSSLLPHFSRHSTPRSFAELWVYQSV